MDSPAGAMGVSSPEHPTRLLSIMTAIREDVESDDDDATEGIVGVAEENEAW